MIQVQCKQVRLNLHKWTGNISHQIKNLSTLTALRVTMELMIIMATFNTSFHIIHLLHSLEITLHK
jgi:hypothetical protein